jgi:hypothetical protein
MKKLLYFFLVLALVLPACSGKNLQGRMKGGDLLSPGNVQIEQDAGPELGIGGELTPDFSVDTRIRTMFETCYFRYGEGSPTADARALQMCVESAMNNCQDVYPASSGKCSGFNAEAKASFGFDLDEDEDDLLR